MDSDLEFLSSVWDKFVLLYKSYAASAFIRKGYTIEMLEYDVCDMIAYSSADCRDAIFAIKCTLAQPTDAELFSVFSAKKIHDAPHAAIVTAAPRYDDAVDKALQLDIFLYHLTADHWHSASNIPRAEDMTPSPKKKLFFGLRW